MVQPPPSLRPTSAISNPDKPHDQHHSRRLKSGAAFCRGGGGGGGGGGDVCAWSSPHTHIQTLQHFFGYIFV
jgi:hypothetical protein